MLCKTFLRVYFKEPNETDRAMESQTEGRKVGNQTQRTADERGGTQLQTDRRSDKTTTGED